MKIHIEPIGKVFQDETGWYIHIFDSFIPALTGLGDFSHIMVVWWGDHFDTPDYRRLLKTRKTYTHGPADLGVFATRSPVRPNPILVTMVKIIQMDIGSGNIMIHHIDAAPESMVLDIKPYYPSADRIRDLKMPEWCLHWPEWTVDAADFDWSKEFNF